MQKDFKDEDNACNLMILLLKIREMERECKKKHFLSLTHYIQLQVMYLVGSFRNHTSWSSILIYLLLHWHKPFSPSLYLWSSSVDTSIHFIRITPFLYLYISVPICHYHHSYLLFAILLTVLYYLVILLCMQEVCLMECSFQVFYMWNFCFHRSG